MNRLLLVRHGSTPATRRTAFPADEALDELGVRRSAQLAGFLGGADRVLLAPSIAARETAAAAGLAGEMDAGLAAADYGAWAGLTLEEVNERDPDGLAAWRQDPGVRPGGGESLEDLVARTKAFLERIHASAGRTIAITDGGVVMAAVIAALGAPAGSFWSVDVAPASITELHTAGDAAKASWRLVRSNWTPPVGSGR